MSRKKAQAKAEPKRAEPQPTKADPQHIKADPTLRKQIRAKIRDFHEKYGRIDKDAIKSYFTTRHPDQANYITIVVDDFSTHLEGKKDKDEEKSSKTEGEEIKKEEVKSKSEGKKSQSKERKSKNEEKKNEEKKSNTEEDKSQKEGKKSKNKEKKAKKNEEKRQKEEEAIKNEVSHLTNGQPVQTSGTAETPRPLPGEELQKPKKSSKKSKKSKLNDVENQQKTNGELPSNGHASNGDTSQSDNAILKEFKEHLAVTDSGSTTPKNVVPDSTTKMPSFQDQMQFLNSNAVTEDVDHGSSLSRTLDHAVLLSPGLERQGHTMPSQYGLLGHLDSQEHNVTSGSEVKRSGDRVDPRVMLNTNIPFSAFICGLQGSGKSHTTSCMIENCSLTFPALGSLKKPVSTLVLNYNEYSSNVSSQPSEAAFLASIMPEYATEQRSIPVRVLVSPTNFQNLGKMYSQIPNVTVHPFRLNPRHLNISMMLSLMSMGKGDSMPLYMAQVTRVLREMAIESGGHFDYSGFRKRLNDLRLDRAQTPFLFQRLDLLDSYLDLDDQSDGDYFVDGGVTILDLSCPFVDENTACILFRIAIDLFLYAHSSRGKMIVADEAHKYMTDTPAARELTETFLNIIRQQRHLGVRTIISTQEPTISPRLIDLCTMTVIHRFSSPEWYRAIRKHVPMDNRSGSDEGDALDGLYRISSLRTGEALMFAPSAHLLNGDQTEIDTKHGAFKMVVRKRVTWDGGRTIVSIR